ncbi:type II toxin-antitoxin system RelE family toxin [Sporosarcina sp. FSL K6-3457]|uniref:type II toxin-antitoxin system RelE family toxin n=1 Tax=Sporosarcina sp. FSL K6-3457 TaxID=2978204 RepID=UPI0030F9FDF0
MEVLLSKQALKFVRKQENKIQQRIYAALIGLEEIPPVGDIKKLKGVDETYRLRVGTFRIIYTADFEKVVIKVVTIDNRGDIY